MIIYTCTNFIGHYPVGTSAIVFARNSNRAKTILFNALPDKLKEANDVEKWIFTTVGRATDHEEEAIILQDGDY